jgi:hypothetical protein
MVYSPLVNNTGSDADQFNGNYLHVGRCGFSNFYGMDVNGAYVAQPLGSASTPWLSAHIGLLSIATNEITTTEVDGDIAITPNGTGRLELGKTFGERIIDGTPHSTYAKNTVYQASTDLFLTVYAIAGGGGVVSIYSDSNSTPTTLIGSAVCGFTGIGSGNLVTVPIKKGDYWKAVESVNTWDDGYIISTLAFGV